MLKKVFKIIGKIVVCLIVLAVVIYILIRIPLWWDDTTLEDNYLQIPASEPVKAVNNAATYIPIQGDITPEEEDILASIPEYVDGEFYVNDMKMSAAELRTYIINSAPLVAKFEKASAQPVYQCPLSFNQIDFATEMCKLGILRQLGSLTVLHAYYYEAIGQTNHASELINATLRMGKLVTERPAPGGPMIETLVGMALTKLSIEALEKNDNLQIKLAPIITNYKLRNDTFTLTLKYEYQSFKNTLFGMNNWQSLAGRGTYLMQPNKTMNLYAKIMRENIEATLTPCDQTVDFAHREQELLLIKEDTSSFPGVLKQNLLGRIFISTVAATLDNLRAGPCEINQRIDTLSQ